jgi:hypothetical protein
MLRAVVVVAALACLTSAANYRPIIGILTLPNDNPVGDSTASMQPAVPHALLLSPVRLPMHATAVQGCIVLSRVLC